MFCVGDIVVYGAHGLCKVDGIGPLPMKFADKSKRYYTLHTCKQPSMTIYAPVDNQTVVIKGLHDRHEIRVQHKKHDTAADERYFRQAQERLYSELAYALGIEEDAVPDYIAQRIALA